MKDKASEKAEDVKERAAWASEEGKQSATEAGKSAAEEVEGKQGESEEHVRWAREKAKEAYEAATAKGLGDAGSGQGEDCVELRCREAEVPGGQGWLDWPWKGRGSVRFVLLRFVLWAFYGRVLRVVHIL